MIRKRVLPVLCTLLLALPSCDTSFSWKYGWYGYENSKYYENVFVWSPNLEARFLGLSAANIEKKDAIRLHIEANYDFPRTGSGATDLTHLFNLMQLRVNSTPYKVYLDKFPDYVFEANRIAREREKGLRKAFHDHNDYVCKTLMYVFSTATPSVTCDKQLFGRAEGEILSDLFFVELPFCIKGFDLNASFTDELTMADYFTDGTMLNKDTMLHSKYVPEELYEYDVNLTFTFPVVEEYYWD